MSSLQNLLVGLFLAAWIFFFFFIVRWNTWRRDRLATARSAEESWLPENEAKLAYFALVEQHPEAELDPAVKKQMMAALLKRAMVDIEHAQQITEERNSLQQLIKEGAIGEDLWEKLQRTELQLNEEILEVINEAESYKDGWSRTIMEEAAKLLRHERQRVMHQQPVAQTSGHAAAPSMQSDTRDKSRTLSKEEDLAQKQRIADKAMKELLAAEENEKRKKAVATSAVKKKR
ncbi:Pre protein translocase subunit Sec66-domain-containing protein [Hyaloraphidium curvatum]|nr:Pre protein translocase subunit Sec66-domain-containing protein [Hyaloraphidium curvatum]